MSICETLECSVLAKRLLAVYGIVAFVAMHVILIWLLRRGWQLRREMREKWGGW